MRVKTSPKHHQRAKNSEKEPKDVSHNSRLSRSEPCLRLGNADSQITMERHNTSQQIDQISGPGIDEVLDLAMPTRARCKHDNYESCLNPNASLESESSDDQPEAIDLSSKNRDANSNVEATFLYKMLTDSSFLENLRSGKSGSGQACSFCKRNFASEDELTEHQNVRKDETNRLACCACGKTFAQKRYLRYHQRCHSERTKFTCDICTKNYSRLDNLTRHNTFHTNPDKFPCTSCERTFARKDLLKKHIKCHENRYRYYCSVCDKYFKGPLSLENHKSHFHSNVQISTV